MPWKGPLTEEQIAKRRAASLKWYHAHKSEFSEEKKERLREHGRKASRRHYEKNAERLRADARRYKASHYDPTKNSEQCKRYRAENRDAVLQKQRDHHHATKDYANSLRRAHHHAHKDEANAKRKMNAQKTRATSPWEKFIPTAQARAAKKNVPFSLTREWARERWTGCCEITGIEFSTAKTTRGPGFFSPSIDRIVPELGYTPENCRFVLWAVNAFKSGGTDEDMLMVARAIVESFQAKTRA